MPPVFAHGRLRLYLLKLLDEAPRHGYEVIQLLKERFQGLYAPSAGTVYPRLAKLEAEGLVTHATEGGRKVYSITDAGRAELAARSGELADLELEIRDSVSELAAEMREDVRGAAGNLRREMRAAASEARTSSSGTATAGGEGSGDESGGGKAGGWENILGDKDTWQQAKEEMRRAKNEWKEQARRAKDESRRARQDAAQARRQAKDVQDEVQRVAKQVQDQVQDHFARGDWPTGVREGLAEITKELGRFGRPTSTPTPTPSPSPEDARPADVTVERADLPEPDWATGDISDNPARDLDRILDRFRDDIRDAARDNGVTADQLREARRHLSTAAAHVGAALRSPQP